MRVKADDSTVCLSCRIVHYPLELRFVQADGNGPGEYMHSGMRGDPHVGAIRHCSFTEAEIELQAKSASISSKAAC